MKKVREVPGPRAVSQMASSAVDSISTREKGEKKILLYMLLRTKNNIVVPIIRYKQVVDIRKSETRSIHMQAMVDKEYMIF